jgi:hypothetical protein
MRRDPVALCRVTASPTVPSAGRFGSKGTVRVAHWKPPPHPDQDDSFPDPRTPGAADAVAVGFVVGRAGLVAVAVADGDDDGGAVVAAPRGSPEPPLQAVSSSAAARPTTAGAASRRRAVRVRGTPAFWQRTASSREASDE